uniref:CCHC-type domain-containing protein n=1 Tax=Oryzias melastigma TaxID=30732 RepID=A0A3B3CH31_ORYME
MLLEHGHQLQRQTAATEAIMTHLQTGQNANVTPPGLVPNVAAPRPPADMAPLDHANGAMGGPRLSLPDKFNGRPELCRGFLMQCDLYLRQQPHLYSTEEAKVSFLCSLLTGEALEWMSAMWAGGAIPFDSYAAFTQQLREVFHHSADGKDPGDHLMELTQGRDTVASYSLKFRTLAARTDCTPDTLKRLFRRGLSGEMQRELACRDEGLGLEAFIQLAIRLDNLMRSRRPRLSAPRSFSPHRSPLRPSQTSDPEPMHLGSTQLTPAERERRRRENLCLYCGQPGHLRKLCLRKRHRFLEF